MSNPYNIGDQAIHQNEIHIGKIQEEKKIIRNIHDPLHKHIELSQTLWKIIDTEQFQRLKRIKYMGVLNEVYSGAIYSVFDISIGAAYLTKVYMNIIAEKNHITKYNYPNKKYIDDVSFDRLICLAQIAALCYNLGQYPYQKIIKNVLKNQKQNDYSKKERSCILLEEILKKAKLYENDDQSTEVKFSKDEVKVIQAMIKGISKSDWMNDSNPYRIYPYWIFKIVKNQEDQGHYKFDIIRLEKILRANMHIFQKLNPIDYYYIFANTELITTNYKEVKSSTQLQTQICDLKLTQIRNFEYEKIDMNNKLKYHKAFMGISFLFEDLFSNQLVYKDILSYIPFLKNGDEDQNRYNCIDQIDKFKKFDDGILSKIYYSPEQYEICYQQLVNILNQNGIQQQTLEALFSEKKKHLDNLKQDIYKLNQFYNRKFYKVRIQRYFDTIQEVDNFDKALSKYQDKKVVVLIEIDDLLQKQIIKDDTITFKKSIESLNINGAGAKFLYRFYSTNQNVSNQVEEVVIQLFQDQVVFSRLTLSGSSSFNLEQDQKSEVIEEGGGDEEGVQQNPSSQQITDLTEIIQQKEMFSDKVQDNKIDSTDQNNS
ncbi:hypothetical protein ABPG74_008546 [Tetrahymena malaccensis]